MRTSRPVHVTVTQYVDPKTGERVTKGAPGAIRQVTKSETWYAKIKGVRYPLGTTDEAEAWIKLRALLKEGPEPDRDPYREHAVVPIEKHIDDWLEYVRSEGAGEERIALLKSRIKHLAALAKWKFITDINPDSCASALAKISKSPFKNTKKGRSAQTRNHYLSHAKQFARYLDENTRLPKHPLRSLRPISVESDRRHDRRAPSDEEMGKLFGSAEIQPVRCKMTGPQRMLGYKVAMAAGLRAKELRTLTRESFDLVNGTVSVKAAYEKRNRKAVQPLPSWLVDELRAWFAAGGACWDGFHPRNPGRLIQLDLKVAGVPYVVQGEDGPLFFDFHALRHWYVTQLANQPGISPKTLMELCRHSTPTLTMKIYAKAQRKSLDKSVNQIPDIQAIPPSPPVS